jgi:hypothetical protein
MDSAERSDPGTPGDECRRKFVRLTQGTRRGSNAWFEAWLMLFDDKWFRELVGTIARAVILERRLPEVLPEDIESEARRFLALDLMRVPDLALSKNPQLAGDDFVRWIGRRIRNACRRGLRKWETVHQCQGARRRRARLAAGQFLRGFLA